MYNKNALVALLPILYVIVKEILNTRNKFCSYRMAISFAPPTMRRILFIITILFLTSALMTQGIFAYKLNAVQTLIAEEETKDDKPHKKDLKDIYFSSTHSANQFSSYNRRLSSCFNNLKFSKGYINKPFTPPDFS